MNRKKSGSDWNDAYADAMRDVYQAFGDDIDVATLFAEALMNRTPWKLWDLKSGTAAADASTMEAVTVLEKAVHQVAQAGDMKRRKIGGGIRGSDAQDPRSIELFARLSVQSQR